MNHSTEVVITPGQYPNAGASPEMPEAPYPGIEPFQYIDHRIFSAREKEAWNLFCTITVYRAVLLYGDSGTGKSSLINAGLVPLALNEQYIPNRLRVQPFADREIKIEKIRKSGGPDPEYLPSSFRPTTESSSTIPTTRDEGFELSLTDFRRQLRKIMAEGPDLQKANFDSFPARTPLSRDGTPQTLLLFDQFEEFITLFEEAQRGSTGAAAKARQREVSRLQRRLLVTLVKLMRDRNLPLRIVFAFREDYLAKLSLLFEHCPELMDQAQRLLPPSIDDLPEIIRAPFVRPDLRAHFLERQGKASSEIDEQMAQRIALKLGEGGTVNLTELQIVCLRLWKSEDAKKLFEEVGIEGLLEDYVEEVINGFPLGLREPAVTLLSRLITASNTRNVIEEGELLSTIDRDEKPDPELLKRALNALVESQLVRREARRNIYFYEITSEYLVHWIIQRRAERAATASRHVLDESLKRLPENLKTAALALLSHLVTASNTRNLLAEDELISRTRRDDSVPTEHLRTALYALADTRVVRREIHNRKNFFEIASDYFVPWIREQVTLESASKSVKRARQWQRLFLISCVVQLIVILAALAFYFYRQSVAANLEIQKARAQQLAAENAAQKVKDRYGAALKVIAGKDDEEKEKAIAQISEWTKEKDFPSELTLLLRLAQSRTDSPRVKAALARVLTEAVQRDPNLEQSIINVAETNQGLAEKLPPRFHIYFAEDRQRALAQRVAAALKEQGWIVRSSDFATGVPPDWDHELRYFQKSEERVPSLPDILSVLQKATSGKWVERFVPGYSQSAKVGPGYYELWFAAPTGKLFVKVFDDQGQLLRKEKITLHFVPHYGVGIQFSRSRKGAGFIDVPPGEYEVVISVAGYKEISLPLSIEVGRQVNWTDLRLSR